MAAAIGGLALMIPAGAFSGGHLTDLAGVALGALPVGRELAWKRSQPA